MTEGTVASDDKTALPGRKESNQSPEERQMRAIDSARSLMTAVVGQVAALIDAVYCDSGEVLNWRYDLPAPIFAACRRAESPLICFAVTDNAQGLHAGGYIDLCMLEEDRRVRAYGGYYDFHGRPTGVCEKDLPLNGLTHERLGQALMDIHAKVIRVYAMAVAGRKSDLAA